MPPQQRESRWRQVVTDRVRKLGPNICRGAQRELKHMDETYKAEVAR